MTTNDKALTATRSYWVEAARTAGLQAALRRAAAANDPDLPNEILDYSIDNGFFSPPADSLTIAQLEQHMGRLYAAIDWAVRVVIR